MWVGGMGLNGEDLGGMEFMAWVRVVGIGWLGWVHNHNIIIRSEDIIWAETIIYVCIETL